MELVRRIKWILTLGTFLGIPFALVLADEGAAQDAVGAWILPWIFGALALHSLLSFLQILASGRSQRKLADLSEFSSHQTHTLSSLEEVFRHEPPDSPLEIKSKLFGRPRGGGVLTAPLSGKKVLAYRVRADLLKKRQKPDPDFLNLDLDQGWGNFTLTGDSKDLAVQGPGLLDTAGWDQKTLTLAALKSSYPGLYRALEQRLTLENKKITAFQAVRLTEVSLSSEEDVFLYGRVRKTTQGLVAFGSSVPEDPDSLLIRSSHNPASSRARGLSPGPWLGAGVGFLLLGVVLALTGPLAPLFETGRGGLKVFKPDHSLFTLNFSPQNPKGEEDSRWTLSATFQGDEGILTVEEVPVTVTAQTWVTLEGWAAQDQRTAFPGVVGGPLWSKGAWVWVLKPLSPSGEGRDPLVVLNQTGSEILLDVLAPGGEVLLQSHRLDEGGRIKVENVPDGAWIRGEGSKGRRLALPLPDGGLGEGDDRILELVPGDLVVSRRGAVKFTNGLDQPVQVYVVSPNPEGDPLYWDFFPEEGEKTLTVEDQDFIYPGQGDLGVRTLKPLGRWEGPLSQVAQWNDRDKTWELTLTGEWQPPR